MDSGNFNVPVTAYAPIYYKQGDQLSFALLAGFPEFARASDGTWSLRWIDAQTGREGLFAPDNPLYAKFEAALRS